MMNLNKFLDSNQAELKLNHIMGIPKEMRVESFKGFIFFRDIKKSIFDFSQDSSLRIILEN